ncbi:hypothetical protein PAXRUDRAFT_827833 [Paxillus rubicundulus Ve08.2h10]|uniref:Uncharacterized protein n=1 Tax=Paxillus rubicundulus Ve08.2h10 TaxID=930991 RepID=A0A0D0E268_9AGAM|nr:hypothetical protein PAXRUDRAFT_827833 [Paxillus rubicundulus Ve08.2h10]
MGRGMYAPDLVPVPGSPRVTSTFTRLREQSESKKLVLSAILNPHIEIVWFLLFASYPALGPTRQSMDFGACQE